MTVLGNSAVRYTNEANEDQPHTNQPSKAESNAVGNSILHSYQSVVSFKINKKSIESSRDDEKCAESVEFKLSEVAWKLKVCKHVENKEDEDYDEESKNVPYAKVELISVLAGNAATWSCVAEVDVKLIALKGEHKTGKIASATYSKSALSHHNGKFIKWDELNENYLKDDMATFEFNVQTSALNRSPVLEQTSAKFLLRLKQVNKFGSQYSNDIDIRGIRWQVFAAKVSEYLQIGVLANEDDLDTETDWDLTADITLFSKKSDKNVHRKFPKPIQIDWTSTSVGFSKYLKWDDFTKAENGYVQNNAALLEIELVVQKKNAKKSP